jgi:recombination protein RecA
MSLASGGMKDIIGAFDTIIGNSERLKKIATERKLLITGDDAGLTSTVTRYTSTQCPALNMAIRRPGIPHGRLTTIIGLEASGKSTLGLHMLAEIMAQGGIGVLLDAEHRLWRERAIAIGIDPERLVQLDGVSLEEDLLLMKHFMTAVRTKNPDVPLGFLLDSVAGAPTQNQVDSEYDGKEPAMHARVLSQHMRPFHQHLAACNAAVIFINQLRNVISFGPSFGRPKMEMLGEKPITYWSSLKIYLNQSSRVGLPAEPTGIEVRAEILKNTIAAPFRVCKFNIDFQNGIDYADSALDVAVQVGIVEQNSAWYKYKDGKSFQRPSWPAILAADPELQSFIEAAPLLWTQGVDVPEVVAEVTE